MGISSDEARQIQFSGTSHSYDASEVEGFRARVIEALQAFEALQEETREPNPDELPAAQRARQQAVHLAERMLRDVMGASGDEVEGLRSWQEAAMLQAVAREEMSYIEEESKRLIAIAQAERDAIRARYAQERRELRAELQRELQMSRAAAAAEADDLTEAARDEAARIVAGATAEANEANRVRLADSVRLERRLGILHQAVADAEARFRRLAATAANDLGSLQVVLNEAEDDLAEPHAADRATIDLTESASPVIADPGEAPISGMVEKSPDVGFYQRRLAGLRDRLEKSGNPPE
ncbi:MAG: hypothetical protein QNJ75_10085 [Acidimicrobiia bacterium]|nr:hypothetical protein [Acidimicrobiia bacterium]